MVKGYFNRELFQEESLQENTSDQRGLIVEEDKSSNIDEKSNNQAMIKPKRKRRKKQMFDAPDGMEFIFNDGKKAKNIYELRDWMLQATDDSYFFHTERNGNDFANWLRGVLKESGLATRVEMIKTRNGTARLLGRFLRARENNKNKY